jgi:AbiJ N-terminal domain 4
MIEQANQSEVYKYDHLPIQFKNQVIHIWNNTLSAYPLFISPGYWSSIYTYLIEEWGLDPRLASNVEARSFEMCCIFLRDEKISIENVIDLIELTFRLIENTWERMIKNQMNLSYCGQSANSAIDKLNARFREHSIGYQYNNGQIMRVDSDFIHVEIVIPALTLLSSQDFNGAEQEFRVAHKYYREQEYKEAIANASKAFESTMKTICDKLGWAYEKQKATASDLIKIVLDNELIPKYLETHLSGLRSLLASTTTVRNKSSSYGQGSDPSHVPEYLAGYALHITASNIVFLVEAYKNKKVAENSK